MMYVNPMESTTGVFREQRREALRNAKAVTGLDYITVQPFTSQANPFKWWLALHFVPKIQMDVDTQTIPPGITPHKIQITIETASARMKVLAVRYPTRPVEQGVLTLEIDAEGEAIHHDTQRSATYNLTILDTPDLDPFFSEAPFRLPPRETTELDQVQSQTEPATPSDNPTINYLTKDFTEFRTLMVNQMAQLMPSWNPASEADMWVMLAEVGAYQADHTSYYQDAVGTEAYLETARKRLSITRLARLTDYRLYEGQNARVWVQFQLASGKKVQLPKGTQLLTRNSTGGTVIPTDQQAIVEAALDSGALVFETLYTSQLSEKQNQFKIYHWGAVPYAIPKGATQLALEGRYQNDIQPGDPLLLIQVRQPQTGSEKDANPAIRQVVRVREVTLSSDPLGGQFEDGEEGPVPITIIRWNQGDALNFEFWVTNMVDGRAIDDITVVRGNLLLADHGRTIFDETLIPETVPANRPYQPILEQRDLSYSQPFDESAARLEPASAATQQDPAEVVPDIFLTQQNEGLDIWKNLPDLLGSNPYAKVFTTELDDERRIHLRFGDGYLGKHPVPGSQFKATYRVGNGVAGNVGSETITQVVTNTTGIEKLTNPLAAVGGRELETNQLGRMYASQAFRIQERAITPQDFTTIAERYPEVASAAAAFFWTGSWDTVFLAVRRVADKPIDQPFKTGLEAFFAGYIMAGLALEVIPPIMVPLDIKILVTTAPEYASSEVRQQLETLFGTGYLEDGSPAFFNPDRLGFGHTIAFSAIADWALKVPGVVGLDPLEFRRMSLDDGGEHSEIPIGPIEIARADNNPTFPQNGEITFLMRDP